MPIYAEELFFRVMDSFSKKIQNVILKVIKLKTAYYLHYDSSSFLANIYKLFSA